MKDCHRGFWVGTWRHDAPDKEHNVNGKRAIVKHLCFAPCETHIWYELEDGRYCREINFVEGLQEGELYTDFIDKSEMLKIIEDEIALCEKYGEAGLSVLFRAEKKLLIS